MPRLCKTARCISALLDEENRELRDLFNWRREQYNQYMEHEAELAVRAWERHFYPESSDSS